MTAVAALGMEATLGARAPVPVPPVAGEGELGPLVVGGNAGEHLMRTLVYGLSAALAVTAATCVIAALVITAAERRAELGVLRAIGYTQAQLRAGYAAGHAVLGGIAGLIGIPLGVAFFRIAYQLANGSQRELVDAPLLQAALALPVVAAFSALAATLPTLLGRRRAITHALAEDPRHRLRC